MYLSAGILFAVCVLFFIFHFFRRRKIICKVRCMDPCKKQRLLNELAGPFGFSYDPDCGVMTSRLDAPQKAFGYQALYDQTAVHFHMVFDCEPVYFDYQGRTWLIEFWKGQYGINIGGEIGIYHADTIISPEHYEQTTFLSASEAELLPVSMELNFKGKNLFCISRLHWWLTGFYTGRYADPQDLSMNVSLTFPDEEMMNSFVKNLLSRGYASCDVCICGLTVSFSFSVPHSRQPKHCLAFLSAQWKNRLLCRLYCRITRPFHCVLDQILFLYFFLPAAFRRTLRFQKHRRQKCRKKRNQRKHCR